MPSYISNKIRMLLSFMTGLLLLSQAIMAGEAEPFFDAHIHYKWDQAELTTPEEALAILDKAGVSKAVVIGRPADFALQLYELDPQRIIPIYGPYLSGSEKLTWQYRIALINEVRQGLENGFYKGIGELHLIGGMALPLKRNKVFNELLLLARQYDVPLMVHTEYSSIEPTLAICKKNNENRFLLAHAGAVLSPEQVEDILISCPNVAMDLSARDPWRYVNNPITNKQGRLLPDWYDVITRHADRFMVGSDPVWPVDRGISWDEADSGWEQLPRFIEFHRQWLSNLPDNIAKQIMWTNAERLFSSNTK